MINQLSLKQFASQISSLSTLGYTHEKFLYVNEGEGYYALS